MHPQLTKAFFAGNRRKLRSAVATDGPIVIPAAGHLQRSTDTTYTFRQDSNFWYLTGIIEPDVVLIMDSDSEYLILPHRTNVQVLFDGAVEQSELAAVSGITTMYESDEGWSRLIKAAKKAKTCAAPEAPPAYVDVYGFYTNPARARVLEKIMTEANLQSVTDIRPVLAELRSVKQPQEIEMLRHAAHVTLDALTVVEQRLPELHYEHEIAALLTYEFQTRQLDHGYEPIVASGKNACTVHYVANNAPIDRSAYVLLDVGAQANYYTADITRMLHPTTPTKRQADVVTAVQDVQAHALSLLKPGVVMSEYEKKIETYMGKQLKKLGLITRADSASVRRYFPYLTSHFLGLDVHDVGDRHAPLQPGMVLTVEPGIHIPAEGIAVRIEDDILITKTGVEILSKQ